jgi:hypothetical protein
VETSWKNPPFIWSIAYWDSKKLETTVHLSLEKTCPTSPSFSIAEVTWTQVFWDPPIQLFLSPQRKAVW